MNGPSDGSGSAEPRARSAASGEHLDKDHVDHLFGDLLEGRRKVSDILYRNYKAPPRAPVIITPLEPQIEESDAFGSPGKETNPVQALRQSSIIPQTVVNLSPDNASTSNSAVGVCSRAVMDDANVGTETRKGCNEWFCNYCCT